MVLFDVVTGVFNVVSNGRRVIIFQKSLEMFRFPVVESSLRFSVVKIKLVAGTAMIFTSEKRSKDSTIPSAPLFPWRWPTRVWQCHERW